MSFSPSSSSQTTTNKYKGVRQRKWGKWVSEIRVPGTPERLWLGSYATPEAAAIAHDVAYYCLRGESSPGSLNFYPLNLPAGAHVGLSPRSVQKVASDAGLAVDARLKSGHSAMTQERSSTNDHDHAWQQHRSWEAANWSNEADNRDQEEYLNVSVEDYL